MNSSMTPRFGNMFKIESKVGAANTKELAQTVTALQQQAESLGIPFASEERSIRGEGQVDKYLIMTGPDATDFAIPATQLSDGAIQAWRQKAKTAPLYTISKTLFAEITAGTSQLFTDLLKG